MSVDAKNLQPILREYHDLDREKKLRSISNVYKHYVPTGKGEEFIELFGSGEFFVLMYSAANGVGKTTVAVNILAHLFWPVENKWFDYTMFKFWPYPKKIRIISEPTAINETIIPEMEFWFPRGRYKREKRNKTFYSYWTTDTGWEIQIMTYDQDPKEFESSTNGLIWFDEPPPQAIYKASVARLRRGGQVMITATPLDNAYWLYDHVLVNDDKNELDDGRGQRTYVEADVESACEEHGVRGFLKHEDIVRMVAEYDEDEKQARIFGRFQHLVGMVFKNWNRKVHVIKPFLIKPQDFTVYEYLDPHPRKPDAVNWFAVDKNGTRFLIDEMFKSVVGDEELAYKIKNKASQFRIEGRFADPKLFEEDQHNENVSLASKLNKYGLYYQPATKNRATADRRIRDALSYTEVNGVIIKAPEFYVFDTCKHSIWEIEHYRWDNWTGKTADKKDPKPKPIDKDDHHVENIGRFLVKEHSFIPYIPPAQERANDPEIQETNLDPFD